MPSSDDGGQVFCVGLAVQDVILSVPDIPTRPIKLYATARREVGGGPAATAAVAVARLGGRAAFAGRLGDDATGAAIAAELDAEGVDTAWLRRFHGHTSASSVILVDRAGERLIVVSSDPTLPAAADWLTPPTPGDAVLCDLSWPEGALRMLAAAQAAGVPSVLDADISRHGPETVDAMVSAASHVVFSRPGLERFTGCADPEAGLHRAARQGHVLTGVTDGAQGLYWLCEGSLRHAPPPQVTAVDTVGAGDAFHGALALALARRWPLDRVIAFANAVAALKCARPGGRAGLPTATELAAFAPAFALP